LTWSRRNLDYGCDITLHRIRRFGNALLEWTFQVDLQIKSTTRPSLRADLVQYDLDIRNYDWLRESSAYYPRVLAVLVMPDDQAKWLDVSEEQLVLRGCMYWTSLKGMPATSNKRTIRVELPRRNVFSLNGLEDMMRQFEEEGEL
jgi:hypothetical protein